MNLILKYTQYLLVVIFYNSSNTYAQEQVNLVKNPSFEDYFLCPINTYIQLHSNNWNSLTETSVDYYNKCANNIPGSLFGVPHNFVGSQQARTGSAYAGIVLFENTGANDGNYREYLQGFLEQELIKGNKYCVEFYVSLSGEMHKELFGFTIYSTPDIGVFFAKDTTAIYLNIPTLSYNKNLNVLPQIINTNGFLTDSLNWTQISGEYTAVGGEKYIIIGNFLPDSLTTVFGDGTGISYYYIDDVSVVLCEDTIAAADTFTLHIPNIFTPNTMVKTIPGRCRQQGCSS